MPKAEAKYTIRAEDQTQRGLRSAESRLRRFGSSIVAFAGRFGGAIGVGVAAVTGLVAGLKRVVTGLDDAAKSAADFGITVGELETLRVTAEQLGVDLNTLLRINDRLSRSSKEAADGIGEYADAYEELQINAEAFGRLSPAARLAALDVALGGVSPERAAALRQEVAGRGATGRIFRGNVRETLGISRAVIGDATRLNEAAAAAERFNDAITQATVAFRRATTGAISENVALVAGSDPVVGAINILRDALIDEGRETRTFRLEDRSIDQLAARIAQSQRGASVYER